MHPRKLLVFACLLASCSDVAAESDEVDTAAAPSCVEDTECESGAFCDRGTCALPGPGNYGAECVTPEVCGAYRCVDDVCRSCVADDECGTVEDVTCEAVDGRDGKQCGRYDLPPADPSLMPPSPAATPAMLDIAACQALGNQAQNLYHEPLEEVVQCEKDEDCGGATKPAHCWDDCSNMIVGSPTYLAAAIKAIEDGPAAAVCQEFEAAGCTVLAHSCPIMSGRTVGYTCTNQGCAAVIVTP